jgi:molybdenum cofactor synthesis domain-containing protein
VTIRFGILTLSDRSARGERADSSGPALAALIQNSGWSVVRQALLPDDQSSIRATLIAWADSGELDVLLTTGGTGFAPRDVTPEATREVIQREAPGLAEAMRAASLKVTPHAMLRAQSKIFRSSFLSCLTRSSFCVKTPPPSPLTNLQSLLSTRYFLLSGIILRL